MNERKLERVARALCHAAATSQPGSHCTTCENGQCVLWYTFKTEAEAAIKAMKGF